MANTIGSNVIQNEISSFIRNPRASVRYSLDLLERLTNGEVIFVDGSNPCVYTLEMGVVNTSVGLLQAEALGRRLYPSMATTQEEAYLHMSDADYVGRFVTPGITVVGFVMPLEEILGKAVPINDGSGARALIIPRHTSVTIGTYIMTLQFPIIIKVLYNGTLNITMDLTSKSPIYAPSTNAIKWNIAIDNNSKWIVIDVPCQQVKIASHVLQVTAHTGYSKQFTFEDEFCHARAYIKNASGAWVEIHTTHQEQVYNPTQPTVCLQVLNRSLGVYIPQIYFQNGRITGNIRIDIYTSKGVVSEDLTTFDAATPKIKFQDLDVPLTEYSTPFNRFSALMAIPRSPIIGGSPSITFTEMITRLRTRSAYTEGLPITNNQLGSMIRNLGFELNTKLDNITNRQFAAVREIDPPTNGSTVTGLGCSIQLAQFTLSDLKVNPIIFESTKRASIKPTELFIQVGNGVRLLDDDTVAELKNLALRSPDAIANIVNGQQYHFTPFHYVLDMGLRTFGVRPYFMTSPKALSRFVFQQNASMGLNIRSDLYGVEYIENGYRFTITLEETATLNVLRAEQLSIQASYIVPETNSRGWLTGELISPLDPITGRPIDEKWMYSFTLTSTFDIDRNHLMDVIETGLEIGLVQEFDIIFVVKDYVPDGAMVGDIDLIISKDHIPNYEISSAYYGVTQEKVSIKFGSYLDNLWRRSRTVVVEGEYRRYPEDVKEFWTKDNYEVDGAGYPVIRYNSESGEIQLNKLNKIGDPVLDPNGVQYIRFHKGDVMLDQDGRPIPIKDITEIARELDLFFVDGRYYFATDSATISYMDTSLNQVAKWIDEELRDASRRCIERTDFYYYPKMSNGLIDVIVGDGEMARLKADQSISIRYVLRKEKFKNSEIRENLTNKTPSMLLQAFKALQRTNNGILTAGDIRSYIKALVKDDVVDVRMTGFLADRYQAALSNDVSSMPTLGKKLVPLSNLTLQVQDDVAVDFEILDAENIMPYTAKR